MYNLFAWLLLSIGFAGESYPPLQDLAITVHQQKQIEIAYQQKIHSINLEFFSENGDYNFGYIESAITDSSLYVFDFARSQGAANFVECVSKTNLEVYDVSWPALNNHAKFSGIYRPENLDYRGIQGLYDPRLNQKGVASIIITGHDRAGSERGQQEKLVLIGHEVAHYWFDRLCLNRDWNHSVEDFAVQFENYYLNKIERIK